ncbi:hypothetical protein [Streptomyces europaeiscabiei]|uniref:hypothetical protein n=1 Tax=Streptomyces europaeiscabiei TaxID=146819 RepID=UPI0038D4A827
MATALAPATAYGGGATATNSKDGFNQVPQKSGALTAWVDSTWLAAAKLYQQHPDVKLDIVTYDGDANGSNYLQTKVQLFNRTGKGRPDAVFSSQNNEVSWAVDAGFAAPLNKGSYRWGALEKFASGANGVCTVDGRVYCLRHDPDGRLLEVRDLPPHPSSKPAPSPNTPSWRCATRHARTTGGSGTCTTTATGNRPSPKPRRPSTAAC